MSEALWRVGHLPNPLAFVPHRFCGWQNRFDDSRHEYRTLYFATRRITCFREVLADLRPNTKAVAEYLELFGARARSDLEPGLVSASFRKKRGIQQGLVDFHGPAVDLEDLAVRTELEWRHAALLAQHDMDHLDISEIRSKTRTVTQTISRTLYDDGAAGILFRSTLDSGSCVAVFEHRAVITAGTNPESLALDIPELLQVCVEWKLTLRPIE